MHPAFSILFFTTLAGTGLMVQPSTGDREWNKDRRALFETFKARRSSIGAGAD